MSNRLHRQTPARAAPPALPALPVPPQWRQVLADGESADDLEAKSLIVLDPDGDGPDEATVPPTPPTSEPTPVECTLLRAELWRELREIQRAPD